MAVMSIVFILCISPFLNLSAESYSLNLTSALDSLTARPEGLWALGENGHILSGQIPTPFIHDRKYTPYKIEGIWETSLDPNSPYISYMILPSAHFHPHQSILHLHITGFWKIFKPRFIHMIPLSQMHQGFHIAYGLGSKPFGGQIGGSLSLEHIRIISNTPNQIGTFSPLIRHQFHVGWTFKDSWIPQLSLHIDPWPTGCVSQTVGQKVQKVCGVPQISSAVSVLHPSRLSLHMRWLNRFPLLSKVVNLQWHTAWYQFPLQIQEKKYYDTRYSWADVWGASLLISVGSPAFPEWSIGAGLKNGGKWGRISGPIGPEIRWQIEYGERVSFLFNWSHGINVPDFQLIRSLQIGLTAVW